jgi:hypothetical protein
MSQTDAELKANHAADDLLADQAYVDALARKAANASKEDTSIAFDGIFFYIPGTDLTAVGTYPGDTSPTTVINNPSSDKELAIQLTLNYATKRTDHSGIRPTRYYLSQNGGAFVEITNEASGPFGIFRQVTQFTPFYVTATIPIGGSFSFATRIDIETQVASDPGDVSDLVVGVIYHSVIGSTI